MDAIFSIGVLIPPAHPSCRCGVAYEQIAEPIIPVAPQFTDVENNGIMESQSGEASMPFQMPKGFEMPISDDEFELIARNIHDEHITQVIPLDYEAQNRVNQAYINTIRDGLETGNETMRVLNSTTGIDVLMPITGGRTSVGSDELEKIIIESPHDSLVLIHNHPSNASFSTADIFITATHPSISMASVVGHDGSIYELRITDNKDISLSALENRFRELRHELLRENDYRRIYGENEGEQILRNDIIELLCDENNWQYRRSYYYG